MIPPRTPILTPDMQQQLQAELRPGERVVWAARPLSRTWVVPSVILFVFGIPFTLFALVWIFIASRGNTLFGMCGLPFVVAGLALLTSPVWLSRNAGRTLYAVTDQRAIVIAGRTFGGVTVQTFLPDRLASMTRNERGDGSGDLIFEQFTQRLGSGSTTVRRGFLGVERVRDVEELIVSTLVPARVRPV